jgi:predicted DNA-binding transcriptional regulator AlpA
MSVLLNTHQAAERCSLSPRTLEKHRVAGGGPHFIRLGSAVRYRLEDLDAWIAANRRRSTSDDLSSC